MAEEQTQENQQEVIDANPKQGNKTLVIVLFGLAALLPEHPATTVAKLAVASPTTLTYAHVLGVAALAIAVAVGVRRYVGGIDPESLA